MPGLHYLGREPGLFRTFCEKQKRRIILEIFDCLADGLSLESACYHCEVPPEEFEAEMEADPRLYLGVQREFAKTERKMALMAREGGPQSKAALEILSRTHTAWAQKRTANLAKQFEDALDVLQERLDPEKYGDAYEIVLKELEKHA